MFVSDTQGRVTKIIAPDGASETRAYTPSYRLESVTDAEGAVTAYTYDELTGLVSEITNGAGVAFTLAYDAAGATTTYAYDATGNLATVTDAYGNAERLTYDEAARLLSITDALGGAAAYAYDALGQVSEVMDTLNGRVRFAYDTCVPGFCGQPGATAAAPEYESVRGILYPLTLGMV